MARVPLPAPLAPLVLAGILACTVLAKFDVGLRLMMAFHQGDTTFCRAIGGLTKTQMRLCYKQPGAVSVAIQGLKEAASECQYQFQNHRWNCSSLVHSSSLYGSPIYNRGYKETAFAHAISAAGVAISVSRACATQDSGMNCGCDGKKYKVKGSKSLWKSRGCSHNLKYGIRFSKMFLDSREEAQDMQTVINLHNNHVGRLTVSANMKTICKCHGVSGSCSMKICWKIVPNIRVVGQALKERFRSALPVDPLNSGNRNPKKFNLINKKKPKKKRRRLGQYILKRKQRESTYDLLYYQKSPNFCEKDLNLGVSGTTGRFCNLTSTGSDSCSALCCGRGYNFVKEKRLENCNCKFHWCCKVECKTCHIEEWKSICK